MRFGPGANYWVQSSEWIMFCEELDMSLIDNCPIFSSLGHECPTLKRSTACVSPLSFPLS